MENQENQVTQPLDAASELFLESLPKTIETGESSEENNTEGGVSEEASAQAETEQNQESTNTETAEGGDAGTASQEAPTFNVNKYLEESSEGLFKTEDDFKGALSKIKEYDTLTQKVQVLESEKETLFANDYIKKLNSLHKEGRSPEQIASFEKLSKLNLDELDPKEALIQNKVLNDGVTRAIAERIVSKQYGLDKLLVDDGTLSEEELATNKEELETAEALMKIDAKPVVEGLRKDLEGLTNFESPEQKALDEAARRKVYEKALEPFTEKLAASFPKEISLEVEEGVKLSYPLPDGFAESIKEEAKEYFNHPTMEVNEQSVNDFVTMKKALFLYDKAAESHKHFYNQGKALGVKETTAKFENIGGVESPEAEVNNTGMSIEEMLMANVRK